LQTAAKVGAPSAEPDATLVIPLRAAPGVFDWEARLQRILAAVPRDRFEVLIVDYGTGPACRARLAEMVGAAPGAARLVRAEAEGATFSIGHARDLGALAAAAPVVLFNDVDFIAPPSTYRAIADEIRQRELGRCPDGFFCVPVAFLTESATAAYLAGFGAADMADRHEALRQRAASGDPEAVTTVAYASSCMVANRRHYLELGGHDRAFRGHGLEDFEFLHRVFAAIPKAPRPPHYYVDFRDNRIDRYRGFRAAFALFGIEAFRKGLFLVHLYHPPRPERGYFRRYKGNARLLRSRMEAFDRSGRRPPPLAEPPAIEGRGNTLSAVSRAPREPPRTMLPLDSPVFESFGGRAGMEAALGMAGVAQPSGAAAARERRGLAAMALLQLYRLAAGWSLSRRDRILLRHAPAEFLAERRPSSWLNWLIRRGA